MNHSLPLAIESKDLIGLILLVFGTAVSTVVLLLWPRLRSLALFLIVGGVAATSLADLNIYSAYWYRGTTRGFEVTGFDVLAFGLLFAALISPARMQPRWYWPASLGPMLLFLLYCIVTTMSAEPAIFGLFEISKLIRGVAYFLAVAFHLRQARDLTYVLLGLAVAVIVEGLMSMRGRWLLGVYRPGGTLAHANSLSMYLCLATPVLIAAGCSQLNIWVRRVCWLAVGFAAVAMILTLSRAGLPIFVVVCAAALLWCGSWRPSPMAIFMGFVACIALTALVVKSYPLLVQRYTQSTLEEEYLTAQGESRGYYFRQAAVVLDEKPLGVGLNNWSYWVSKEYGKALGMNYENYDHIVYAPPSDLLYMYRFAAPAHNLGVLTAAELGWPGLALLLLMWVRWFQMGASFLFAGRGEDANRVAIGIFFGIGAVFLHSFTEWTFRQTEIFFTFNMLAGGLAAIHMARRAERTALSEAEAAESYDAWDGEALPAPASVSAGNN